MHTRSQDGAGGGPSTMRQGMVTQKGRNLAWKIWGKDQIG